MGNFNDYIVDKLDNSDIMVVEANHDVRMLEADLTHIISKDVFSAITGICQTSSQASLYTDFSTIT